MEDAHPSKPRHVPVMVRRARARMFKKAVNPLKHQLLEPIGIETFDSWKLVDVKNLLRGTQKWCSLPSLTYIFTLLYRKIIMSTWLP